MSTPDLTIALGPRSLLSLIGLVTIIAGVWHVDRTWDEKGSAAYTRAAARGNSKGNTEKDALTGVTIPDEELDQAFVFPWAFIIGWLLFAAAFFFPSSGSTEVETTKAGLVASVFSLALAYIASIPMANAVMKRDAATKQKLSMAFVSSWLGLTVATSIDSQAGRVAPIFCVLGAVSIIASMKVLWKYRKMGDSWEKFGKPNPNPIVYNIGGPMFVFGWFLFWIGTTATDVSGEAGTCSSIVCLPLYFTSRSLVAFLFGCGMVPVVLFADYAHDEGGEYVGFGTDGRFFGRFLETPIPFLTAWTMFGVAALMPIDFKTTTVRQWIILANCILQGFVAGILIQTALYEGDMAAKTKWSIPFVILFIALAIEIGLHNGLALAMSLPGAILIILGQKTVFGDRKRGDYFMIHHEASPNPIVYSYGEIYFMAGWILISWAMSFPME